MRGRLHQGLRLFLTFSGMAILAGCEESGNSYVPPPPPPVRVAQPVQQPVTLYFELTGNTAPLNSVDIEARVQEQARLAIADAGSGQSVARLAAGLPGRRKAGI